MRSEYVCYFQSPEVLWGSLSAWRKSSLAIRIMHVCLSEYMGVWVRVLVCLCMCMCVCLVVANSERASEIWNRNSSGSRNDGCLYLLALGEGCPKRAWVDVCKRVQTLANAWNFKCCLSMLGVLAAFILHVKFAKMLTTKHIFVDFIMFECSFARNLALGGNQAPKTPVKVVWDTPKEQKDQMDHFDYWGDCLIIVVVVRLLRFLVSCWNCGILWASSMHLCDFIVCLSTVLFKI